MATNKKPRKKYVPNKRKGLDSAYLLAIFNPMERFFNNLKKGKCDVFYYDDTGDTAVVKAFGENYSVYLYLQQMSNVIEFILKKKNVILDYSPLYDFAKILVERHDNLYFDYVEIQKAKAFVNKLQNIFIKVVTDKDIYDAATELKEFNNLKGGNPFLNVKYKLNLSK